MQGGWLSAMVGVYFPPSLWHAQNTQDLLSGGVAVESQQVPGAGRNVGQGIGRGDLLDVRAELLRRLLALEGQEVGAQTSNVGAGHGGAADGLLYKEVLR